MISIDRVYKTILVLANSDVRGNITPKDIRLFINATVNEIYEEYFSDKNRLINRQSRGLVTNGVENLVELFEQKINYFSQDVPLAYVTTRFQIPSGVRYIDSVWYNGVVEVEPVKDGREFKMVSNNKHTAPTEDFPIYHQQGSTIKIAPSTIQSNVTMYYLREPLMPNWTYIMVSGAEIFDPSATDFRDIDLHSSEEYNVILKTLKKCGINLKEQDLTNFSLNQEAKDFNQENTM